MTFETLTAPAEIFQTARTPFGTCDSTGTPLFNVREGIPFTDAVTHISHLLKCAGDSAYELVDCGVEQQGLLWSALNAIESAKALADALLSGAK